MPRPRETSAATQHEANTPIVEIDADLPCFGCGYNLRSLRVEGVCPECGIGVYRTVHIFGEETDLSSVKPLYYSAGCVLWCPIIGLVCVVVLALVAANLPSPPIVFCFSAFFYVVGALSFIGETHRLLGEELRWRRGVLLTILGVGGIVCGLSTELVAVLISGILVLLVTAATGSARSATMIAGRTHQKDSAMLSLICTWLGVLSISWLGGVIVVSFVLSTIESWRLVGDFTHALILFGCFLVNWILSGILMYKVRRLLRRILPIAEYVKTHGAEAKHGAR